MRIDELQLSRKLNRNGRETVEASINGSRCLAPRETGNELRAFNPQHLEEIENLLQRTTGHRFSQEEFDEALRKFDATGDFSRLGNSAIASSYAFKKASETVKADSTPIIPVASTQGKKLFSEISVIPLSDTGKTFKRAEKISRKLSNRYDRRGLPLLDLDARALLEKISEAVDRHEFALAGRIDAERLKDDRYRVSGLGKSYGSEDFFDLLDSLIDDHGLFYLENPFWEDPELEARLNRKHPETLVARKVHGEEEVRKGLERKGFDTAVVEAGARTVTGTRGIVDECGEASVVLDPVVDDPVVLEDADFVRAPVRMHRVAEAVRGL